MSDVIYEKAGLISCRQLHKVFRNKDTMICKNARVTEKANEDGVWKSEYSPGLGIYALSSAFDPKFYTSIIYGGGEDPFRCPGGGYLSGRTCNAGLRVALQLIYNPKSNMVKNCKREDFSAMHYHYRGVSGEKDIIKFGCHDYVWLNKKECKSGKALVMELWNDELEEKAVPFVENEYHTDYGKAKRIRKQCQEYALSKCTPEELAYVVTVKRTKDDEYETSTPVLNPEAQLKVIEAFDEYKNSNKTQEGITKLFAELDKVKQAELEKEYASDEDKSVALFTLGETCGYMMKHFEKEIKTDKIKEKQ